MSVKNIQPLGDRVLVKRAQANKTKGGILLPETAQEKPKQGEVVAVGPGKMDGKGKPKKMNVRVGDSILYSSYAGTEVKSTDTDEEYLILTEEDILGILS